VAMGGEIAPWRRPDCGLSAAQRFSVVLEDGRRAFVKAATDDVTAGWLRSEHRALAAVAREFMPRVLHWDDPAGGHPLLIAEHLDGHWSASHAGVHWRPGDIDILLHGVDAMSATTALAGLESLEDPTAARWC